MIVDTSVIIAILKDEQDAASIGAILSRSRDCRMSAVSYVEAAVVVDSNQNPVLSRRFDDLLRDAEISVEPVTLNQARIAREAYRDFG
ncbi:MAG: type II toxin-antitoxin system VapC family toxin, partial [Candidatus Sulfotelmatobacter sp.]